MLKSLFRKAAFWLAHKHGKPSFFYRRVVRPTALEHAELLRRHAGFYAVGDNCSIQPHAVITDPPLTRLGNNVRLAGCKLIAHDGSINMLNRAFGLALDSIGAIDIEDDVFIGEDAIVLGGVRIGARSIVAAGALVTKDVESGWVVGGVPARPICRIEEHVVRLQRRATRWPWMDLVEQRQGELDVRFEAQMTALRQAFFFGPKQQPAPYGGTTQPEPGTIAARCTQTESQALLQQNASAAQTAA